LISEVFAAELVCSSVNEEKQEFKAKAFLKQKNIYFKLSGEFPTPLQMAHKPVALF